MLCAMRPPERDAVLTRLELTQCPPAEVWRRLEEPCRMAAAIVEALAFERDDDLRSYYREHPIVDTTS